MRMPLLVLGLIVVVGIASLCPGAEVARRPPSAVKRSRTRQPKPVLRECWCKRLCSRNVWARCGESFQGRRRVRKALRLLRQWMLAG